MGYEKAMMGIVGIAVAAKVIKETEKTMHHSKYKSSKGIGLGKHFR